jgi:hypothetical protein
MVLLASLGATPEAIAQHLAEAGVRGVPQNAFDCALSRYLSAVIPTMAGIEEIVVGRTDGRSGPRQLILRLTAFPRWTVRIDLAEEFQQFLASFDAGCYRDLLRGDSSERASLRRGTTSKFL